MTFILQPWHLANMFLAAWVKIPFVGETRTGYYRLHQPATSGQ